MNKKYDVLQKLESAKVVAVIRGASAEEAIQLSKGAIEGGIQAIEVTYTTPNVAVVFQALEQSNALLGAGTVLDAETARHAMLSGAKFIVSPHFEREIATVCNRYGIPYLPGCMTIKEMVQALEAGCDVLKLFPANNFDASFIRSVNGPLPHVRIMPTGGIHLENMKDWLEAGAVAVGIGSDLNKAYRTGGFEAVVSLSQSYMRKSAE
ncbi:bifunctional 2-keto-4-hydroxyglutarate aldolase/2-keto-3-deoxy-6-phosphogluconate aldolase [Brevibacillus centrosporus]|uniref:bifunctional 2-keto-4-hydroxyglutarate aldolase/2-keto-3-deoxy-6-phosphogluconate aldolase n=1 Tax=Brevibacillus centrosporus TaxID=54910 RepID=UPI002E223DFF|nr:bifunctional 2-keto-4-hydroxyglutarate aldolase/2-keto-3-deoxy-6-phosphogluconate aldolase [Brevibacillus centrosporus]MED1949417.1 bifunctional 2-keto-4-hydroxyglutarate aldolase/2-keto-3-deoxy-6-phosphogluconate aldolase [Brevibacillus centrosporus]